MDNIDPDVKNLVSAIGRAESGNPSPAAYTKKGASGEFGRYQFMPDTYKAYAKKYIGNENAEPTVENQNKIAYSFVKEKKDAGFNPAQIASMWNAGEGKPNAYKENYRGVNSAGVAYDTPAYAQKVSGYYNQTKGQTSQNTERVPHPTPQNESGLDKAALIARSVSAGGKIGEGIGTLIARAKTKKGDDIVTADYEKITPEAKARLETKGIPTSRDAQLEESAKKVKGPSAGDLAIDTGKAALQVATAVGAGKAISGIRSLFKGASALESTAVKTAMKEFDLPMKQFKLMSNGDKAEYLTQALNSKTLPIAEKKVMEQALNKVLPAAIKEAGGDAPSFIARLAKKGGGIAANYLATRLGLGGVKNLVELLAK